MWSEDEKQSINFNYSDWLVRVALHFHRNWRQLKCRAAMLNMTQTTFIFKTSLIISHVLRTTELLRRCQMFILVLGWVRGHMTSSELPPAIFLSYAWCACWKACDVQCEWINENPLLSSSLWINIINYNNDFYHWTIYEDCSRIFLWEIISRICVWHCSTGAATERRWILISRSLIKLRLNSEESQSGRKVAQIASLKFVFCCARMQNVIVDSTWVESRRWCFNYLSSPAVGANSRSLIRFQLSPFLPT